VSRRAVVLAAGVALVVSAAAPAAALEPLPAVLHVHSTLSTGSLSLEEIVAQAERHGIGAVLLSENYLARVEYGLPPFRALTRVTREERSVRAALDVYLARVAHVRAQFPRMLVLPGVEVIPHYRWTGAPWSGAMTLHDTQKNLLVFGLEDPRTLAGLPVAGNRAAGRYSVQSLLDALPVLLLLPGVALLARSRTRRVRLRHAMLLVRRRAWLAGAALCCVALAAAVRAWPFTTDVFPSWVDAGPAPYQALIDHVDRLGGLTVWSFPEARDAGEQDVGPVRVSWSTEPYADDLLRTFRYTAFGAVYEDVTTFERPGGGWDRLLGEYAAGERSRPVWAVAESGFHGFTAGKRIGPVQTVLLVTARSEAGVLDALRRGRMWAVHNPVEPGLELVEFTARAGTTSVTLGETLGVAAGTPIEIHVALAASDGGRHDVRVSLVRNGEVVGAWADGTPFRAVHREVADGRPAVFRVEARGPGRVLANPIFVGGPRP